VVAQDRQRDEVAWAQAERRKRRLGAQPHEAREVVEQRGGAMAGGGRDDDYKCRAWDNSVVCYN